MHRAEVERIAADELANPADIWLAGIELADLLHNNDNNTSELDPDRVRAAIADIVASRPHWARQRQQYRPGTLGTSGAASGRQDRLPSWSDLLRGGDQR